MVSPAAGAPPAADDTVPEDLLNCPYEFPESVYTGPALTSLAELTATKHKCADETGDVLIRGIPNKGTRVPTADCLQSHNVSETEFLTSFSLKLNFFNKSQAPLSVVEVFGEYFDASAWQLADATLVGSYTMDHMGDCAYRVSEQGTAFTFDAGGIASKERSEINAVQLQIKQPGQVAGTRRLRRLAPTTLPQPLQLRVTVETISGAESSLIIEHVNPKLDYTTTESVRKRIGARNSLLKFTSTADLDTQDNVGIFMARESGGIYFKGTDSCYMLSVKPNYIDQWLKAAELVQEEIVDGINDTTGGVTYRVDVLVDLAKRRVKGFKVSVTTSQTSAIEYVPFPRRWMATRDQTLQVREADASGDSALDAGDELFVKPTKQLSVRWSTDTWTQDDRLAVYPVGSGDYVRGAGTANLTGYEGEAQLAAPEETGAYEVGLVQFRDFSSVVVRSAPFHVRRV